MFVPFAIAASILMAQADVVRLPGLMVAPNGLTAALVAELAVARSFSVRARQEMVEAARARALGAALSFIPRVRVGAGYARISTVIPPPMQIGTLTLTFPTFEWIAGFQGDASIALTDYALRYAPLLSAARRATLAREDDVSDQRAVVAANAELLFYAWVKAMGRREIAAQSVALTQGQAKDARNLFAAGRTSKADLLSLEAQVQTGRLDLQRADDEVRRAAAELRTTARLQSSEVVLGEVVTTPLEKLSLDRDALVNRALRERSALRRVFNDAAAQEHRATATLFEYFPRVELYGATNHANPNLRFFPYEQVFHFTWEVGVRVIWNIFELAQATPHLRAATASARSLREEGNAMADLAKIEVARAVVDVQAADSRIVTTKLSLRAAEEAYRLRRDLFGEGRSSSVELLDAQLRATRARLEAILACVEQRVTRVRLNLAVGVPVDQWDLTARHLR